MPRVGTSIEEQITSGGFKFEEGNGVIVAAVFINDQIGNYDAKCGLKVSIQRMTKTWKPTGDEPVEEILGAGPLVNKAGDPKFHPGNASSSDDPDPEDCGDEIGVEGNCLYAFEGAAIDKKSKLSIFSRSMQETGLKPALLNGYAPNLVGLKGHFKQLLLEKGANFTGTNDPTCLVVDSIANLSEINGSGKAAPAKAAAGNPAAVPAKPAVAAAKAPVKAAPAPVAAPAAETGDVDEEVDTTATSMLSLIAQSSAGQTLTRQKVGSKLVTMLAKNRVPVKMHKPVQNLINTNDAWFEAKAEEFGWGVDGIEVTFPAAEEAA